MDLRSAETRSNILIARIILQANFWISWSLEIFFLDGITPYARTIKKPAENKSIDN